LVRVDVRVVLRGAASSLDCETCFILAFGGGAAT